MSSSLLDIVFSVASAIIEHAPKDWVEASSLLNDVREDLADLYGVECDVLENNYVKAVLCRTSPTLTIIATSPRKILLQMPHTVMDDFATALHRDIVKSSHEIIVNVAITSSTKIENEEVLYGPALTVMINHSIKCTAGHIRVTLPNLAVTTLYGKIKPCKQALNEALRKWSELNTL